MIGKDLHVPAVSISPEEAKLYFGLLAMFVGADMAASSRQTQQQWGGTPLAQDSFRTWSMRNIPKARRVSAMLACEPGNTSMSVINNLCSPVESRLVPIISASRKWQAGESTDVPWLGSR